MNLLWERLENNNSCDWHLPQKQRAPDFRLALKYLGLESEDTQLPEMQS